MSAEQITKEKPKEIDNFTKTLLVLVVIDTFEKENKDKDSKGPSLVTLHKTIDKLQEVLEQKYNRTMGYKFTNMLIDEPWSEGLQRDLEIHDTLSLLWRTDDDLPTPILVAERARIRLQDGGKFILKVLSRELKGVFGDQGTSELRKDITRIVREIEPFKMSRT
ncbi:MAG: hypothetical protein ABSD68_01935 [Candidatus Micrarchaeales archaeon]|jgi:hypothetical protein